MNLRFCCWALLLPALMSFQPCRPTACSLTVQVSGLRNALGHVQFALYNQDGTIPDEHYKKYYKLQKSEINNRSATTTFEGLPPGTYAVNILHDENRNGQIDKGFVLPVEGVGFSHFSEIGLTNRPSFGKASFPVAASKSIAVKVIYF
jgi:uncharacterized protein (DUF2141 family)